MSFSFENSSPPTIAYSGSSAYFDPYVDIGGDAWLASDPNENTFTCFARDTLISTPTGSTPVQDLRIGDLILNHQGQAVPVKWIGTQRFHPAFGQDHLPVRISVGALGNDNRFFHLGIGCALKVCRALAS